ncbi:hypothetical protein [Streptosporangium sp. KLBMP 9127]
MGKHSAPRTPKDQPHQPPVPNPDKQEKPGGADADPKSDTK